MNNLIPLSPTLPHHAIINASTLGETSKEKYRREIDRLIAAGIDPLDQPSLSQYASTLPHSSRAVLKAALNLLHRENRVSLKASATPDNLDQIQARLYNLDAMTETIKVKKPQGKRMGMFLSRPQIETLLSLPDRSTVQGRRDWLILAILLDSGLRISELANMTFSQVRRQPRRDGQMRPILDVLGKGKKRRTVPISPLLEQRLLEWKGETGDGRIVRAINKAGAINGSLTARAVENIVHKYGSLLGLDELEAHDLRRTYAQTGINNGVPIQQISVLLGHSSITITQRYLDLEIDIDTSICDYIPL